MADWIKIDRKILHWEWYKDSSTMRVWLHILLKVNWKPGRFQGKDIPAGSFITSYRHMADELQLSINTVRRAIKNLKMTGEVDTVSTSRYTLISVKKWDEYQKVLHTDSTANCTTGSYAGSYTDCTQYKKDKNNKNVRKKEKEYTPALSSEEDKEWEAGFGYEPGD